MEKIKFSILCESFNANFNTKLYSIINAFETLRLPHFPNQVSFAMLIFWVGKEFNESSISGEIVNHNGDKISTSFSIQMNIPFESYNISFCTFQDINIVDGGTIFAEIKINNITIESIPIPIQ